MKQLGLPWIKISWSQFTWALHGKWHRYLILLFDTTNTLKWGPSYKDFQSQNRTTSGPWFNIKMSYQYRKSHCGDKTVVRSSYLHNGISYTGKMSSLYWIGALVPLVLTQWGWDKVAAISQTTSSNAFSWMKIIVYWFEFNWNLYPRVQLTICNNWFR